MIELYILEVALQGIKTIENYECCERILKAAQDLNVAETECRRSKAAELIMAKAKLEISLSLLEQEYDQLKRKQGRVKAVEELIFEQKKAILHNSLEKSKLKRIARK